MGNTSTSSTGYVWRTLVLLPFWGPVQGPAVQYWGTNHPDNRGSGEMAFWSSGEAGNQGENQGGREKNRTGSRLLAESPFGPEELQMEIRGPAL